MASDAVDRDRVMRDAAHEESDARRPGAGSDREAGGERPGGSLIGTGARFAIVGAGVAGLYVVATLLLSNVAGLPFQIALAIGLVVAIATHFLAQRLFVYRHDDGFALPLGRQAGRYLVIVVVQYVLNLLATALLPDALGVSVDAVYLVTTICLTSATFLVMRRRVFQAAEAA